MKEVLTNCALGLAGESGEVGDIIKKHLFHGHPLDEEKLIKELGDVCYYLAWMCNALGTTLSVVMEENINKLRKRYPEGFSEEASINRVE